MKDYSLDLRYRIVDAVAAGQAKPAVAARFAVSLSTLERYVRNLATTGMRPGRPRAIPADQDATLAEYCHLWAVQYGVQLSPATRSRALARAGLPRKKIPDRQRAQ